MTREPDERAGEAITPVTPRGAGGIFVLTAARSGSTLLRYLLDSHPAVGCPTESPVGQLCKFMHGVWTETMGPGVPGGPDGRSLAREAVNEVMRQYLGQRGKHLWCEKSTRSVLHLRDITATFPDAVYVCLYRHAMDMIASGLDASRWGYGRYGFQPYVERQPDNVVAALGEYWADWAERMMKLERDGPWATARLTYEDLVSRPHDTLVPLFEFIGVDCDAELVDKLIATSLARSHDDGRQDHKIGFSAAIHEQSVGRGRAIPASLLGDRLRGRINELLDELGYAAVDDDWNTSDGPLRPGPGQAADGAARRQTGRLLAVVGRRAGRYQAAIPRPAALRVADATGAVSYLDLTTARVSDTAPPGQPGTWATSSTVLGQLVTGQLEIAQAVAWGLLCRVAPHGGSPPPAEVAAAEMAEQQLLGQIFAVSDL
jgi:hypothetical protein